MKPDRKHLDALLQIVAETFGTNPRTPTDFVALASDIQKVTGRTIGLSTLKRLWGYVKDQTGTTYSTLTLLSRYCGYTDWDAFCRFAATLGHDEESGFTFESVVESRLLPEGSTIELRLGLNKKCVLHKRCEPDCYDIIACANIKLRPGDTLHVSCMSVGRPFEATDCRRGSTPLGNYTGARTAGIISIEIK